MCVVLEEIGSENDLKLVKTKNLQKCIFKKLLAFNLKKATAFVTCDFC